MRIILPLKVMVVTQHCQVRCYCNHVTNCYVKGEDIEEFFDITSLA